MNKLNYQVSNNKLTSKSFLKELFGLFFFNKNTNPLCSSASAVHACRHRLKAAATIMQDRRLPPIEAAIPIIQGWKSIAVALMGGTVDGFPEDYKNIIREEFEKQSELTSLVEPAISDMSWLEGAIEARQAQITLFTSVSRYEQALSNLKLSCSQVAMFCAREASPKRTKISKAIKYVLSGIFVIVMLSFICGGIAHSIALPKPDEGLFAVYFTKPSFKGHPFTRIEHTTRFDLTTRAPVIGLNKKKFSSYLEGCVYVFEAQPRKLVAYSSGPPVTVYIDDEEFLRIKKVKQSGYSKRKPLTTGRHKIRIEIARGRVPSTIVVGWDDNKKGIIPLGPDDLAPPGGNSALECPLTKKEGK